jgi:hypothetical protein
MTDTCECGCVCCNGGASEDKSVEEQTAALEKEKQEIERRLAELQRS